MNKNELIALVARTTGLPKMQAAKAVDAVFEAIGETLAKGNPVQLLGFGTFDVAERAATKGRNPRTGEEISIGASIRPKFRAGKGLKTIVCGPHGGGEQPNKGTEKEADSGTEKEADKKTTRGLRGTGENT